MLNIGSEAKLTNGKRAAKYVVIGFEKPLPMFEEGGGNNGYPQAWETDTKSIFGEGNLCSIK